MKAIGSTAWPAAFPDDYRWSFNTLLAMAAIRNGGADMGEIDEAVRQLSSCVGDDQRWFDVWFAIGDRARRMGDEALTRSRHVTAAEHYRRAAIYSFVGERFVLPKTDVSQATYRRAVEMFRTSLTIDDPTIEHIDVPFDGGGLPATFTPARRTDDPRPPVAVLFTGFDGNKELNWVLGVPQLVARGMACISVDTPGVGEAIRFRGHRLRHDYEVVGAAVLDYLEQRSGVDPSRVGIIAMSLGGYYASRAASLEPRFKACVAWGAQWDYHDVWKRRIESAFEAHLPVPGDHLMWSTGTTDPIAALRQIEGFRLDGVVQHMRCPFLACHGSDDQQIPVDDARRLVEACGSTDKELRLFGPDEGGTQHCNLDNLAVAVPYMADWLAEKLGV